MEGSPPHTPASVRSPRTPRTSLLPLPDFDQLMTPVIANGPPWRSHSRTQFRVYSRRRRISLQRPLTPRTGDVVALAPSLAQDKRGEEVAASTTTPAVPAAKVCDAQPEDEATAASPLATAEGAKLVPAATHEGAAGVVVPGATPPAAPALANTSASSQAAAAGVVVPFATPSAAPQSSKHADFISKIVRHAAALLPSTAGQKCHSKAPPSGQTPRRSRRIAGVQAEFQVGELDRRLFVW